MTQTLDPQAIQTSGRQRQKPEVDDLFVASIKRRLIHPIVVRKEGEAVILVAGGHRLEALRKLEISPLIEGLHFRFMDDLSPEEAKVVELEENAKRSDLPWRDYAWAVGELHNLYKIAKPTWRIEDTAHELSVERRWTETVLSVFKNLNSPLLRDATGIMAAYSILQSAAERRAASIISEITQTGAQIFGDLHAPQVQSSSPSAGNPTPNDPPEIFGESGPRDSESAALPLGESLSPPVAPSSLRQSQGPIICADFLKWAPLYSGPKFTLIHCDFPFGIGVFQGSGMKPNQLGSDSDYEDEPDSEVFWKLLDCLTENIDRLMSYQSHLMFWFSMNHYEKTKEKLLAAGLMVLNHPLIWHKSDDRGMIPGRGNHPRRVYETAFLCSLGQRPLLKKFSNCYSAPTAQSPINPSQKPEPVLRHFFSGLVDETTDVLDPTCGSGSAIRAAEDLGARSAFGLELNPQFAETANSTTLISRQMRKAAKA